MKQLLELFIHRVLRVPYALHVTSFRAPKKPVATIVLIHGIGNNAHSWDDLIPLLPKNVRVIGVDLLGFGKSPKPSWITYDATQQARALGVTLLKLGLRQQVILVGHSLGALVSVAAAKRYPLLVKQLVLCSPPFYSPKAAGNTLTYERVLRELYTVASRYPERLVAVSPLAVKFGLVNKSLNIDDENVSAYVAALSASIINQTSLADVRQLKLPIRILYGVFDPVIVSKHIVKLGKEVDTITSRQIMVGHEVTGAYVKAIAKELTEIILPSAN